MADTIKIGNLDISSFKVGNNDCSIYLGDTKLYPQSPTPTGSTCYEIISTPITSYTSTTYDSVYSFSDSKWYMLNNLNQYEEYGVYDIVENISSATTYEGKLGVVGETEYQYSGGSWSVVGSYVDSSVTYTIDDTSPSPYVGQELSTTFKIPYADVESVGFVDLSISTNDGDDLRISLETGGFGDYSYEGSGFYQGTVTNDGEYVYLSLPSEAPQSIVINSVYYWNSTPIHLIVGSKQATVEYLAKNAPSSALTYSSVADMEAVTCPTIGVGQYCYTDGQTYKFTSNDWVQDSNTFIKQFYNDGRVGVLPCGYNNNVLIVGILGNKEGSSSSSDPTIEVIIGDCITTIDNNALSGLRNMSACTIGSGVTSIGAWAFKSCSSLENIAIPNSVTSFDARIFDACVNLTSVIFGDNVTQIGGYMFNGCTKLSSVTFNTVTPPPMPYSNTFEGCSCTIYVPAASLNAYKSASGWSTYSSRIQAIPSYPKWIATYTGGTTSSAACDGTSAITYGEVTTANLVDVQIGDCVTSIGDSAFTWCTVLTSITIPDSVTEIGNNAFYNCLALTSITIPDSVTEIGSLSIAYCTSLSSATIGSGVTSIGGSAFQGCASLTSLTIEATTPPALGTNAFNFTPFAEGNGCIHVPTASVDAYKASSGFSAYSDIIVCEECSCETNKAWGVDNQGDDYVIPVTNIGFRHTLVMEDFDPLFDLELEPVTLTVGSTITSIDESCLAGFYMLEQITLPSSITEIGDNAFQDCEALVSFTIEATTPPTLGADAFDNTNDCPIYVPSASVEAYKAANNWSTYASRIQAIS